MRTVWIECGLAILVFGITACAKASPPASPPPGEQCRNLEKHGQRPQARQCFEKLAASAQPAARAEGLWGLHRYQEANDQFKAAVKSAPKDAGLRVRWASLFLERFNPAEAAQLFTEALEIEKDNAPALLGMARVASRSFENRAVEMANKALAADPKLVEAQELLAFLALEDNNADKAVAEADKAIAISPEALDALAIRATIDWMADRPGDEWIARIRKVNPGYGKAYATAAHFFVLNRRYEEGIKLYRQALELDPELQEARAELGVNLMRLGREEEARQQLEQAYQAGFRNALTSNSLTLMDSYKNFETIREGNIVLKLHKKEAEVLRPYVESELKRAIGVYEKKYRIKLDEPVQLELYPDHEDFAVRTMGMPGLGALGVTFGNVVAMDSPSGRPPGQFHWASTLWHELSHVYVLSATKHRVPRWFTEGLAVHEETAASPDWGDRLDPQVIAALKNKKLLPVEQLDRGFIRPTYPGQVVVSYFQAGRICDYIAQTWGYDKLLGMMQSFAEVKTTPAVVEQHLGVKPEEFDKQFFSWLEEQTGGTVLHFSEWAKRHKALVSLAKSGKHDEVLKEGAAIRDWYKEYVEGESVYELMANAYLAGNDKPSAIAQLHQYATVGGRSPVLLKKLAALQEEAGKKQEAAKTLERLNWIYPLDEEQHRRLGGLLSSLGDKTGAVRELNAVVALKPQDQAGSRLSLAQALRAADRLDDAREQVLLALEAAPGYKPAQQLLLELSR